MALGRRKFLGLAASAASVNLASPLHAAPRLSVVATTGMIADAARQIGGDLVAVQALMGPGVDPHSYRQTRSDIVALTRADLVLRHGLYLEAQMEDFFDKLSSRGTVTAVADALPRDLLIAHSHYGDKFDPHVWMVPALWARVIAVVRDTLVAALPDQQATLDARAAAHLDQIAALQSYAETTLATVPADTRVLLTAHDAFGYFGRAFAFEVVGIQGISTESEAGLNRIGELVEMLVSRRIGAAFVETSVSDRNIRALIEGAAARGHTVRIGGELFSDAMGPDSSYEGTYLGMLDHNITTIARALGGTVPPRGMTGQLGSSS